MESLLVPDEITKEMVLGYPNPKPLPEWIYKIDLAYCNILVTEPLHCLNFVTEIMHYYDDKVTHGLGEHWLQNPKEIYEWIFYMRKGDCDDACVTLASILHSVGNKEVRFGIGYYGNPKYANTEKVQMNHAYCLLHNEAKDTHLLIDAVGDQQARALRNIDTYPEYITMMSAAADGRLWFHGPFIDMALKGDVDKIKEKINAKI